LPEIISKPLNDEIKKWEEDFPKHPFWQDFFSLRLQTIHWLMMERFLKLPAAEKKDYGEIVVREFVSLAQEKIPTADPKTDHIGQNFRVIAQNILWEFDGIDDGLGENLKKQLTLIIFATSNDEELINFAAKELAPATR